MLELHPSFVPATSQVSLCSATERGAALQGSQPSGLHPTNVTVAIKVFMQMIKRRRTYHSCTTPLTSFGLAEKKQRTYVNVSRESPGVHRMVPSRQARMCAVSFAPP